MGVDDEVAQLGSGNSQLSNDLVVVVVVSFQLYCSIDLFQELKMISRPNFFLSSIVWTFDLT